MKNIIPSVKGTRDFYPEDMSIRSWLYSKVRHVSNLFGYQEYEGPLLESIDLYAAKSGEELVKEQSFVFPDRGGDLLTLRPELTPTLARMVAQRQNQLIYPLRWWSYGPFWRYERPQKGRTREFFQWNIDLIGVNSPEADAELIAIVAFFLSEVSLTSNQVKILINDRKLVETELLNISIPTSQFSTVFKLIDRKEKLKDSEWIAYGIDLGLDQKTLQAIIKMLNDKQLWKKSENLNRVFTALDAYGVMQYIEYDPNIIRGLDYYTSTVFEAKLFEGNLRRSILGGGRYDNLLEAVGGKHLPAVGFAMGDVVISLILHEYKCLPADINKFPASVLITVFDEKLHHESINLSSVLRINGINAICYPEIAPISKQFKFASRIGASIVVVIGPDEVMNNNVSIKSLITGYQKTINKQQAVREISSMLENVNAS